MQEACTSFRYRLLTSTIKSYKMNIKKNIIKTFMGGIAACLCMYNPQIEMFAHFKTKSSFHKTKRII